MFPTRVDLNQDEIDRLVETYRKAQAQIISEIEDATSFGTAHRKVILAQINEILKELDVSINDIAEPEIRRYYEMGADDAVKQLNHVGADVSVSEGFNRVNKDAISALVDDTAKAFGQSIQGVGRSAGQLLGKATRDQITQQLATGKIQGSALREIKKNIVSTLKSEGLDAIVDRSGKGWTLDRYAEMLIRTKAVEARNRGLANRIVENGYDLVQVSAHGADDVCADWEGEILSATGNTPGYPTVADAEADGLFHPNCKHAINVLVPELAKETDAYNSDE